MSRHLSCRASERGAILVHTAIIMLFLIAFTAFVVDYGTLWASRRQAQNAADAAALAGAVTLAFDDPTLGPAGSAYAAAQQVAQRHRVWDAVPGNRVLVNDLNTDPDNHACPTWETAGVTCVRVDVHRDGTNSSTQLPMFFGTLFNKTQQRLRATATAHVTGANTVRCVLPLILADRWADVYDANVNTVPFTNDGIVGTGGWTYNDSYEKANGDYYTPPYQSNTTGWTVTGDFGRQLVLHEPIGTYSAGWAGAVDLPNGNGADVFRTNMYDCNVNNFSVGIAAEAETCTGFGTSGTTVAQALTGCLGVQTGNMSGPTGQGVDGGGPVPAGMGIVEQDPGARWSATANNGRGGVVDASGNPNMDSPRIRPVPVMNPDHYVTQAASCSGTGCIVKVSNIIGFFVEGMCDDMQSAGRLDAGVGCDGAHQTWKNQVVGRIVTLPGSFVTGNGAPVTPSSFVRLVRLIR